VIYAENAEHGELADEQLLCWASADADLHGNKRQRDVRSRSFPRAD